MSISFSIALPHDPAAAGLSRDAVKQRLEGVLPDSTLSDVTLVVSELVANAVLHGAGDIELNMKVDDVSVKGEVVDEGDGFNRRHRRTVEHQTADPHGLLFVEKLTECWGVFQGTTHVWFEMSLDADADDEVLPADAPA